MNTDKIRELINEREQIDEEEYWTLEKFDIKISNYLSENMDTTIFFLKKKCSGLDLVTLSETFHLVAKKSQSIDFVNAIYETALKFPKETEDYNLLYFIENARRCIK